MKQKKGNRGSSLVSVMIAFLILEIGLLMFSVAMMSCIKVTNTTRAIRSNVQEAMKMYYTEPGKSEKIETGTLKFVDLGNKKTAFKMNADFKEFGKGTDYVIYSFDKK